VEVVIEKLDVGGSEIQGATLTLTGKDPNGNVIVFEKGQIRPGMNGEVIQGSGNSLIWISGTTSTLVMNLKDGTYVLHEELAPKGYKVASDVAFRVRDGVASTDYVVMVDEPEEEVTTTATTTATVTTTATTTLEAKNTTQAVDVRDDEDNAGGDTTETKTANSELTPEPAWSSVKKLASNGNSTTTTTTTTVAKSTATVEASKKNAQTTLSGSSKTNTKTTTGKTTTSLRSTSGKNSNSTSGKVQTSLYNATETTVAKISEAVYNSVSSQIS
jgi:hypothetical protein